MGNNEINEVLVKIKQEKIDTEIETKLTTLTVTVKQEPSDNSQNGESDSGTSVSTQPEGHGEERDEKKTIEPVKSSNEILAELFKVFNAAPPEQLLDDKRLLKKEPKQKKHKKEKKKKRSRDKGESVSDDGGSQKHSKKKKHKHKKSDKPKYKDRDTKYKDERDRAQREYNRDREPCENDITKSTDRSKESSSRKERTERSSERSERHDDREKDRGKKEFSVTNIKKESAEEMRNTDSRKRQCESSSTEFTATKRRCQSNKIKIELHTQSLPPARSKDRDEGHVSEVSLSDEETYLKERERYSDKNRRHRSDESSRSRHERSGTYGRSDGWRRRGTTTKSDSRKRSSRSRSRSRTRSRSRSLGIDKKRLLEIARKNAISMFKRGSLPGCANMTEEVKDKVLLKMRYGGRTVQDLTEFCKKISNGENLSDLSSDEDSDVDKCGNAKAFHHPFQLKEREPIVMHIRNSSNSSSTALVSRPAIEEQTKVITMQFPVSSGQQHRMTEAWVPVETREQLAPLPTLPAAKQSTMMFKTSAQKNVFGGTVPQQQEQEPAFTPSVGIGVPTGTQMVTPPSSTALVPLPMPPLPPDMIANISLPPPPLPPPPMAPPLPQELFVPDTAVPSMLPMAQPMIPSTPLPVSSKSVPDTHVFPQTIGGNFDVSAIISKRLNAMRRLQDNPLDPEALKMMHSSQRDMTSWASSKHLPGQFTGSTGATLLKAHELNSGPQVWARRDQLTTSRPVTGGMGMQLLQKMGWKPGEGLGRERNGALTPLLFDVKLDKRGLVSKDDTLQRQANNIQPAKKLRGNNGGVSTAVAVGGGGAAKSQTVAQAQQSMQDKHPVCLLNELTSKRKWQPPLYTLVNEVGPSHSKTFHFSVSMNGQTFTPPQSSNSKKEAKVFAARFCLQQIGILPPS